MTTTRFVLLPVLAALVAVPALAFRPARPSARVYAPEVAHHRLNAIAWATPTPAPATPTPVVRNAAVARGAAAPVREPSYVVLIVLDGARPDYLSVPGIPHVQALIRSGAQYTNAWAGILESETPSGHASIATGSQPRRDGILSFDWANSQNESISIFSEQKIRAGLMEQFMRQAPAPTIAGLVHRQNPKARVVALSGYKYYAADALGGPNADVIMYFSSRPNGTFGPTAVPGHIPPAGVLNAPGLTLPSDRYPLGAGNHQAMKLAAVTFARMHQQVTLINLPEFDWPLGHGDGANRDQRDLRTLMHDFDGDLAMLEESYRQAGVLDRTLFILTADHGFAPIDHRIPNTLIDNAVLATGTKIIRDAYHTASYIWLLDESKAAQAASNIAKLQNPYIQSVYFRATGSRGSTYIRASGPELFLTRGVEQANQWLLNTFNGPNGPDVVTFMTEQSMVWAGTENTWKGDHGGATWESQQVPLVLSGPGIRPGYTSAYPAPLMDIAPTLLSLLQVPSTGMQGIPLADAMNDASPAMRLAQGAQGEDLSPVATALKTESRLEVGAGK